MASILPDRRFSVAAGFQAADGPQHDDGAGNGGRSPYDGAPRNVFARWTVSIRPSPADYIYSAFDNGNVAVRIKFLVYGDRHACELATANTVIQTSSVASENCSLIAAIVADGRGVETGSDLHFVPRLDSQLCRLIERLAVANKKPPHRRSNTDGGRLLDSSPAGCVQAMQLMRGPFPAASRRADRRNASGSIRLTR